MQNFVLSKCTCAWGWQWWARGRTQWVTIQLSMQMPAKICSWEGGQLTVTSLYFAFLLHAITHSVFDCIHYGLLAQSYWCFNLSFRILVYLLNRQLVTGARLCCLLCVQCVHCTSHWICETQICENSHTILHNVMSRLTHPPRLTLCVCVCGLPVKTDTVCTPRALCPLDNCPADCSAYYLVLYCCGLMCPMQYISLKNNLYSIQNS